jgi:Na+/proline symporter
MPAVLIGLYTRWFNAWALLIGWAAGTFAGTYMVASVNFASTYSLTIGGWTFPGYIALYALILNLVIAIVVTPLMNTLGAKPQTRPQRRIITPDISSSATEHSRRFFDNCPQCCFHNYPGRRQRQLHETDYLHFRRLGTRPCCDFFFTVADR